MAELVYLGFDRAGLGEARRDVERHAAQVAAEIFPHSVGTKYEEAAVAAVLDAIECKRPWPTAAPSGVLISD